MGDEIFLEDIGAGEYTKDYFSERRYEYLCNSSRGHNVPVINNMYQKRGKEYKCSKFDVKMNGFVEIEFSGAYKKGLIDQINRNIFFDMEKGILKIKDNFITLQNEIKIIESFVTKLHPVLCENYVCLQGKKSCVYIETPKENKTSFIKEQIKNHEGEKEIIYLIQFEEKNNVVDYNIIFDNERKRFI